MYIHGANSPCCLACELSDKHLQGLLYTSFSVLLCPVKRLENIITSIE